MDFIRLHHKYQARLNPSVIVMDDDSMYRALLNPKAIVLEDSSIYNDYDVTKLDVPSLDYLSLIGCSNGLLCSYGYPSGFRLYNPATGAFLEVPYFAGYPMVAGFGYDYKNEDHKIVVIKTKEMGVFIYSLSTKSWRKARSSYPPGSAPCGYKCDIVFVNNAFHWTFDRVRRQIKEHIMSFDLSTEQYHELPMPKLKHRGRVLLSAPDILHLHLLQHRHVRMDLWIMKEYGVQQSWTKLFSITDEGFDMRQFCDPLPVAYLKGKSQILLGSTEKPEEPVDFMVYKFKTKKLQKLAVFDELPEVFRARHPDTYINETVPIAVAQWAESLFPL